MQVYCLLLLVKLFLYAGINIRTSRQGEIFKKGETVSVKHLHCMYTSCSVSSLFKCIFLYSFLPLYHRALLQANKVFAGNISPSATSMKLFSYFSRFGPLLDIHIPGRHRGSCFVKFRNGFDSLCLLNTVHIFEHYCLVVKEARTKECASN